MASAEKRQRRRKKGWGGQPRAEKYSISKLPKYIGECPIYVDFKINLVLFYIYKHLVVPPSLQRKCTVESSTESESESNNEFLDPYDGDSEDASTHSDCSLNSLNDINYNRVTPLVHNLPEMVEDIYSSENRESLHMSSNWVSPVTEICDVYMQPVSDLKIQMEVITKEKSDVPVRLARPCELSRTSGVLASAMWLTSDCSLFVSGDPSKYAGVLESPVTTTLQQPMLEKPDGENTMCDQSIKRKLGLPFLEGIGEKLRRKKLRAT
ncbi:ecto-NOX disulfide-thiol exchanger 1 [Platysternon megacephalum]|uniref:Ecto-NOX disulfide-thiol exchanger 1 n=1 Tax=Platysternon megacephalum TaxID=55544 RepID=A0A4D9FDR4_9SAUR|nr:ecto-NOX disulfide-thiol exchanger 1 [Platysternon megacephalum]